MRSLSPKLSSRIAEIPYSVFATNVNNVSGYIAKYFTFDLRNDVIPAQLEDAGLKI